MPRIKSRGKPNVCSKRLNASNGLVVSTPPKSHSTARIIERSGARSKLISEGVVATVDQERIGGVIGAGIARDVNRDRREVVPGAPAPRRDALHDGVHELVVRER